MNDLLDEAAAALRDETASSSDDGRATLARLEGTLAAEGIVDEATRLLRDQDTKVDPAPTLARIERSLAVRNVRDRYGWALAAAALLALVVGAPTAWAWSAGLFREWTAESEHAAAPPRSEPAPVVLETAEPTPMVAREPAPEVAPEPAPVVAVEIPRVRRAPRVRASVPREVVEDEDVREERLFASAHRAHFADHDRESALRAWDEYLAAYPSGRYAPEAHYNRALTLVRLGRLGEARAELEPFASGGHGGYRGEEAASVIDAIDARTSGAQ